MRPAIPLLVLCAAACSKVAPMGQSATVEAEPAADAVERAVCLDRPGCRIESQLPLDRRADGGELLAVVARLPERAWVLDDHVVLRPRLAGTEAPSACTPFEVRLVSRAGGLVRSAQWLMAECSIAASPEPPLVEKLGDGEVRCTVHSRVPNTDQGRPVYTEAVEETVFTLDPPRVSRTTRRHGDSMGANDHGYYQRETSWDALAFRGEACWRAGPECSPILPAVLIAGDAGAFVDGAWKSTALGDCAMALEGESASVRAVLSDDTLFLEVTDDVFVTRGAVVDAIEVVSESEAAMPGERDRHETLAMDGTFTDGSGKRRQLDVVEAGPKTRRFAVTRVWPPDLSVWSLSYVDTDDGRTVRQRISSVPRSNRHGQAVLDVDPLPTCAVRDHVLQPPVRTGTGPDVPLVP